MKGRVTNEDRIGNSGADALAVAGAKSHQVPAELVSAAHRRRELALEMQAMMLAILQERLAWEQRPGEGADHGSDRGDDDQDDSFFDCVACLVWTVVCMSVSVAIPHSTLTKNLLRTANCMCKVLLRV